MRVTTGPKTWLRWTPLIVLAAITIWAAFAPIHFASREVVFEIPKGTFARRMAGNKVDILPDHIYLTLGQQDVLVLTNMDEVPQIFGPTLLMPGQSFRLPFEVASDNQFSCTAHSSGQMTIVVDPQPEWPWQKLSWRLRTLYRIIQMKLSTTST